MQNTDFNLSRKATAFFNRIICEKSGE